MAVEVITSRNFEEFVKHDKAVLDFYADWCGPCRMLGPVVERVSEELKETKFGKANVDKDFELGQRFMVMAVPTVILFSKGKQVDRFSGAVSKDELVEIVKNISKK